MLRLVPLALLLAVSASVAGQDQTVLFPGQTGAELRASIRAAFRPVSLTGDNDDLYARIDSVTVDGQLGVIGVYTGLFVPFDCNPSCDPSQDVFNNNAGLNQEHTFPRAELAGGASHPSENDLHNLFPTRVSVNADRGNLPFAEIPDNLTTRWYRDATSTTIDPPENERDAWSELRSNVAFEPREVHEGNVARAMFYMATVWDDAADQAWFATQQADLYAWHQADPVDQAEVVRSALVAAYQRDAGGQPVPNPFVVDSTLMRRAYFVTVDAERQPGGGLAVEMAGPNPFRETTQVRVRAIGPVRVSVVDALGREVAVLYDGLLPGGERRLTIPGLGPGVYTLRAVGREGSATRRLVRVR